MAARPPPRRTRTSPDVRKTRPPELKLTGLAADQEKSGDPQQKGWLHSTTRTSTREGRKRRTSLGGGGGGEKLRDEKVRRYMKIFASIAPPIVDEQVVE